MKTTMINKILSVLAVFFLSITSAFGEDIYECTKLYMKPSNEWKSDKARFAAYFYDESVSPKKEAWVSMSDEDGDGIYELVVPSGVYKNVIFCRMKPSPTTNNWDNKWNQSPNLTYDGKKNQYDISGWNNGSWNNTAKTYNYFITGNGTSNNAWCNGVAWEPGDCDNKLVNNQITFTNLPKGDYQFKITNGSWTTTYAYTSNFDEASSTPKSDYISYINTADDNIKITTSECSDITVKFNPSAQKKISVQIKIHEPKYYLRGLNNDWTTGKELKPHPDPNNKDELVLLGQKIFKATDAVKIVKNTPCGDEFYADVKIESPVPFSGGGSQSAAPNIVLEDGIYDFYFDKNYVDKNTKPIYIGGELDKANVVYLDPKAENGDDWEVDGARFAVYYFKGQTYGWVSADKCGGLYFASIPAEYDEYIWARIKKDGSNNWDDRWNQTGALKYDKDTPLTMLIKPSEGYDYDYDSKQTTYTGVCGNNYKDLDCTFPTFKDTVFVHINKFVENDLCNYVFDSFEQAFAVLKTRREICDATTKYYGTLKQDEITLKVPVVMLVHYGPEPYRGTEKVGMSGGHINDAPAIFFRNINKDGNGEQLIVRSADPKGNRAVIVHPVIRRSTNIVLDNLNVISDPDLRDNAIDIDTGEGENNLEGLNKDFNVVPLSNIEHKITLKNSVFESYGRNCIHVVGIKNIHVENNEFYTKYDFSVDTTEGEDVVDWGGTIKFINTTDVRFLRNDSEGTLATSFFIQGCQRVLLMNNVFWNDNAVSVPQLAENGRTVANVRLVSYAVNPEDAKAFPLKNIGIYYNTFFIKDNDAGVGSYHRFDFFRLGGLKQKVDDNFKGNFDPSTIRFQYNNCYSFDKDIYGNNDDYDYTKPTTLTTFYLQEIGLNTEWCECFRYNNFWGEWDKDDAERTFSSFELGKFCTGENETYNLWTDVKLEVCKTEPHRPGALVVKGDGMNIGTIIDKKSDVSLQGVDTLFNDRLNPENGANSIRPHMSVNNSNEALSPYDHIYLEPGTINLFTSPIIGSQTTDVMITSILLTPQKDVKLTIVDKDDEEIVDGLFALTNASGVEIKALTTDNNGSLNNTPVYVTFVHPRDVNQETTTTYEAFLKVEPSQKEDAQLVLHIPLRGHYIPKIASIKGAWTVGAFQQREVAPVDTIIWHGSVSGEWDDRNNWYKTDGNLVTCLDALTEDLTVIIPAENSEKYVTPAGGITQYPKLPRISNDQDFKNRGSEENWKGEQVNAGDNDTATEVAHKIFMEYGSALVGVEGLGTKRYSEAEVELVARRNEWLLVGSVINPWELDEDGKIVVDPETGKNKTRQFVSGDYYYNHLPHVYMHKANVAEVVDKNDGKTTIDVTWDRTFAPLDVPVLDNVVYAIRAQDQYGPEKLPAAVYDPAKYNGKTPITYNYKGRFYNDSKLPTYKDLKPKVPTLLTNTYPANINAYALQEDKGTILIYDYANESFRTVKEDDVILSQHGFVFTPKDGIEELEVDQEAYIINTATGHRSLLDEILSLRIQVKNEKKSVASEVCIRYDELKEDVADYAVDAPKVFNGMVPALPDLYVIRYDSRWAGVSVPEMNKPIPLGVRVYANNVIFNFSLTESNLPYDIILEDREKAKIYNLSEGETCEVEGLQKGRCEGRFYLFLSEKEEELPEVGDDVATDVEETAASNIDIFTQENSVVVSSTSDVELMQVIISDVSGRHQVYNVSGQYVQLDLPVNTGVYTISVIGDKSSRIEKIKLN
jgi:hypothetical protein